VALLDLLGRRWALGIIWNLYQRPMTFRSLQGASEKKSGNISPSINSRIKDLREAKLVTRTLEGYELTLLEKELLEPLDPWSHKWNKALPQASKKGPSRKNLVRVANKALGIV
jgi:DNA-binding HxlR family transcriptional regulator